MKTLRINAFFSLLVVAILYQLANIAYFAAGRSCAHSNIAGVKVDFGRNSFQDRARTLNTNSRQLILSESIWLERYRQRSQLPYCAERIWQPPGGAPRPITRYS